MIKEGANHITPEDDFVQQVQCVYQNERYAVRDNGAVLRFPCNKDKPRPTDHKWMFGKLNEKTGYLVIARGKSSPNCGYCI